MVVKRIGPLSLAKILGCLYGGIALFFGFVLAVLSIAGAGIGFAASDGGPEALLGIFFGVGAVILLPLFYGGLAFLMGLAVAALYNLVAGWIGGIELEMEVEPRPPTA